MSFIVHSIPGSPCGQAVLATLVEKGAEHRFVAVPPMSLREPEHLSRHPFGRVPVLEHDGFVLYETQAILRYLDRILPEPALTPTDARAAARMDQVMGISDWYLFQGVGTVIVFQRVVAPRVLGLAPDEAACAAAMPRAHVVMETLSRILGDGAFFTGEHFTLAELLVIPQLTLLAGTPEWRQLVAGRDNLQGLLDRTSARPCFAETTWAKVAAVAAA